MQEKLAARLTKLSLALSFPIRKSLLRLLLHYLFDLFIYMIKYILLHLKQIRLPYNLQLQSNNS